MTNSSTIETTHNDVFEIESERWQGKWADNRSTYRHMGGIISLVSPVFQYSWSQWEQGLWIYSYFFISFILSVFYSSSFTQPTSFYICMWKLCGLPHEALCVSFRAVFTWPWHYRHITLPPDTHSIVSFSCSLKIYSFHVLLLLFCPWTQDSDSFN